MSKSKNELTKLVEEAINDYNIIDKAINACPNLPSYLRQEAESVSLEYLWSAALAYDPEHQNNASFVTFAWKRLMGGILSMLRKERKGYITYVPKDVQIKISDKLPDIVDDFDICTEIEEKIDSDKFFDDLNYIEKTIISLSDSGYSISKISKIVECSPGRIRRILMRAATRNNIAVNA